MERLSDTAIEIINELHTERLDYSSEYIPLIDAANRLAAYEDLMERWKLRSIEEADRIFQRVNALGGTDLMAQYRAIGSIDHLRDLLQAEKEGRMVKLPFVAMVEQSLQGGKMKPMGDQKHNGRYAVVYVDHNKWKSPLIDICGKPYDREEAEARMAVLAQKGGSNEQAGNHGEPK